MKSDIKIKKMVIAALLCAIGIIIPILSPLKITLEPASFTLASHVPVFIAAFISPFTAIAVSAITSLGFLFAGFPIVVVLRAVSHIIFATLGALYLKKYPDTLNSFSKTAIWGVAVSVIHALGEIAVVIPFYFSDKMGSAYYSKGFVVAVVLLVGVGTVIHSLVDLAIARVIWKPVCKAAKLK